MRPVVLDDLTRLAARLFDTPMSTVTLIDRDRQWFAGNTGMPGNEGPRELDFVASVSHELRTPVTTMQGYLEMLAEQRSPGWAWA